MVFLDSSIHYEEMRKHVWMVRYMYYPIHVLFFYSDSVCQSRGRCHYLCSLCTWTPSLWHQGRANKLCCSLLYWTAYCKKGKYSEYILKAGGMLRHQKLKHFNHVQYKHMCYMYVILNCRLKSLGQNIFTVIGFKLNCLEAGLAQAAILFLDKDNFVYMWKVLAIQPSNRNCI